jgi:hypothetical protein
MQELRYKTEPGNSNDYNTIVSDSQAIRYVAKFMHQTGLLHQFRKEVEANMEALEETAGGH